MAAQRWRRLVEGVVRALAGWAPNDVVQVLSEFAVEIPTGTSDDELSLVFCVLMGVL